MDLQTAFGIFLLAALAIGLVWNVAHGIRDHIEDRHHRQARAGRRIKEIAYLENLRDEAVARGDARAAANVAEKLADYRNRAI